MESVESAWDICDVHALARALEAVTYAMNELDEEGGALPADADSILEVWATLAPPTWEPPQRSAQLSTKPVSAATWTLLLAHLLRRIDEAAAGAPTQLLHATALGMKSLRPPAAVAPWMLAEAQRVLLSSIHAAQRWDGVAIAMALCKSLGDLLMKKINIANPLRPSLQRVRQAHVHVLGAPGSGEAIMTGPLMLPDFPDAKQDKKLATAVTSLLTCCGAAQQQIQAALQNIVIPGVSNAESAITVAAQAATSVRMGMIELQVALDTLDDWAWKALGRPRPPSPEQIFELGETVNVSDLGSAEIVQDAGHDVVFRHGGRLHRWRPQRCTSRFIVPAWIPRTSALDFLRGVPRALAADPRTAAQNIIVVLCAPRDVVSPEEQAALRVARAAVVAAQAPSLALACLSQERAVGFWHSVEARKPRKPALLPELAPLEQRRPCPHCGWSLLEQERYVRSVDEAALIVQVCTNCGYERR